MNKKLKFILLSGACSIGTLVSTSDNLEGCALPVSNSTECVNVEERFAAQSTIDVDELEIVQLSRDCAKKNANNIFCVSNQDGVKGIELNFNRYLNLFTKMGWVLEEEGNVSAQNSVNLDQESISHLVKDGAMLPNNFAKEYQEFLLRLSQKGQGESTEQKLLAHLSNGGSSGAKICEVSKENDTLYMDLMVIYMNVQNMKVNPISSFFGRENKGVTSYVAYAHFSFCKEAFDKNKDNIIDGIL